MTSLRGMLVRRLALGAAIVVLCSGTAGFLLAQRGLRRIADESLVSRAESFAALVIDELPDPDDHEPGGLVFDYQGPLDEASLGLLLRIKDERGRSLAQSPDWPVEAEPDALPESGSAHTLRLPDGRAARLAVLTRRARAEVPAEAGDGGRNDDLPLVESSREITVLVIGPAALLHETERAVLLAILTGAIVAGAGVSLVVLLSVRRGLAPVGRLAADLQTVNPRHPRDLASHDLPDELAPIAGGINDLMARIRAALAREQRFTDAAAHELRTPLAELASIASVAAKHPEPDRLHRGIVAAGEIASEMTELIEALLLVSRGDDRHDSAALPVALMPILTAELERHERAFAGGRIGVEVDALEDAAWRMPPGAARAVLRNLIDNAVEYTPEGGRVRVVARPGPRGATVTLSNGPVELQSEQVPFLFEPFWRGDLARSDRRHRGLGLAIVAALCERAALTVEAALTRDAQLRIRIAPAERTPSV